MDFWSPLVGAVNVMMGRAVNTIYSGLASVAALCFLASIFCKPSVDDLVATASHQRDADGLLGEGPHPHWDPLHFVEVLPLGSGDLLAGPVQAMREYMGQNEAMLARLFYLLAFLAVLAMVLQSRSAALQRAGATLWICLFVLRQLDRGIWPFGAWVTGLFFIVVVLAAWLAWRVAPSWAMGVSEIAAERIGWPIFQLSLAAIFLPLWLLGLLLTVNEHRFSEPVSQRDAHTRVEGA